MNILQRNSLRVMSFNIQLDVSAPERMDAVRAEIEQYEPDLLGLQEINQSWKMRLESAFSEYASFHSTVFISKASIASFVALKCFEV